MHKTLGTFGSPELEIAGAWPALIGGIADLRAWWRVGTEALDTIGTKAAAVLPKMGAASLNALATEAARPTVLSNGFGDYPALNFDGVGNGLYQSLTNIGLSITQPASFVLIGSSVGTGAEQNLMSVFVSSANSIRVRLNADNRLQASVAGATTAGKVIVDNQAFVAVLTVDGTTAKMFINGKLYGSAAATLSGLTGTDLWIGAANASTSFAKLRLAEAMLIQRDISTDASSLKILARYASAVYGAPAEA